MRQPGIFGQMCWDTYTVGLLGFHLTDAQTPDKIVKGLDEAAVKLLAAYPFLAGKVVNEGRSSTNSGTYKIAPYTPHADGKSPVRRKDCKQLLPSYDEILKADAPFSMLDGEILCPARGFGYAYDPSVETPVLILQANFVRGGLLLCFASQHNAIDMNGQEIILRQLAALLRGEELDPKLVAEGNQDADSVVPLLKKGETALEHDEMRKPSGLDPPADTPAGPPPHWSKAKWVYWRFPKDKLAEVKRLASSDSGARISTNDAITAFWTQRLTVLRIAAGRVSHDESIHCLRAANGRSKLKPPVSKYYMGHMVGLAYTEWPAASDISESPLSKVASDIRASLDAVDDHYVRSLATLIHTTQDKTTIFYGAKKKESKDTFISSWAQMDLASNCDFGPLFGGDDGDGRPDFLKRAKMDNVPDLMYVMPKNRDGDMDVGACMFEEDIEGLEADEMWKTHTRMIG